MIFFILILILELNSQEIRTGTFIYDKTNLKKNPSGFTVGIAGSLNPSQVYSRGEQHSIGKNPATLFLLQEFNPNLKNSSGSLQRDPVLYENIENRISLETSRRIF